MDSFIKQPDEEYPIVVDFSAVLGDGETISTKTVTATLSDVSATTTVIDSSSISGDTIILTVKGGTENNYKITVKITTSLGNVYEKDVLMNVRNY